MSEKDFSEEFSKLSVSLQNIFGPEELHPDLKDYVVDGNIGKMLHHPLYIQVMYTPSLNKMINTQYRAKMKARDDSLQIRHWPSFIFLHERPYRIEALSTVLFEYEETDPKIVWNLIRDVWIDSENIHQNFDEWCDIWNIDIPNRLENIMDDEERKTLAALPDIITIHRGADCLEALSGMSWTLDLKKAHWFANRFSKHNGKQAVIISAEIKKSDVLALFLGRGEQEIVIDTDVLRCNEKISYL